MGVLIAFKFWGARAPNFGEGISRKTIQRKTLNPHSSLNRSGRVVLESRIMLNLQVVLTFALLVGTVRFALSVDLSNALSS
jgi:hypothetical protein